MNRRDVTKSLIYRYLNARDISVAAESSKFVLLEKLFEFWNSKLAEKPENAVAIAEKFPVEKLARQFSIWFFTKFNENQLSEMDFSYDAKYTVVIMKSKQMTRKEEGDGSFTIVQALQGLHTAENLRFCVNDGDQIMQGNTDLT